MNETEKIQELIEKLNHYTALYDAGTPDISDEEWDKMYFELKELEKETGLIYPNSPTQTVFYDVVNSLKKVEHNHKMLSLDKTKSIDEVQEFLGNQDFLAMAKMDGLTCSLRYVDGELISAETRGNGIIGEDVTHNALVIPSIPKHINLKQELIVDGEIICTSNDFEYFKQDYKNPRNFAAGSIRLLSAAECALRKLTFIAWDAIEGIRYNNFSARLQVLGELGFTTVPWVKENVSYAIGDIQDICKQYGYPIDGIVFKFEDVAYGKSLGETDHHFKNAIAYKFYDEEYETKLLNIEWSMGRTGILTPVAIFEPVDDGDSVIERASLHNLNIMKEILGPTPYFQEKVWVCKQNMIIPQIVRAEKELPVFYAERDNIKMLMYQPPIFEIPKVCPICGQPTAINESEQLYCTNPDCDGKLLNKLEHFFGKKGLDVKGISKATFEKLIDWGWINNCVDVFFLSDFKDRWMKQSGFGEKSVMNILNSLNAIKENISLDKFICAIGIPLIGSVASKVLAEHFFTWADFRNAVNQKYHFSDLYDFGYTMEEAILNFNYAEADKLAELLNITYKNTSPVGTKLVNMKIAITGTLTKFKNRAALEQAIAAAGGKSVSSVTKNTNILINNNPNSTSAKNIAAKKLNIPILTEEEFAEKYLD